MIFNFLNIKFIFNECFEVKILYFLRLSLIITTVLLYLY